MSDAQAWEKKARKLTGKRSGRGQNALLWIRDARACLIESLELFASEPTEAPKPEPKVEKPETSSFFKKAKKKTTEA